MGHPRVPRVSIFNRPGHAVPVGHPWQSMPIAPLRDADAAELKEARIRAGFERLADEVIEAEENTGKPDPPLDLEGLRKVARVLTRHALVDED